MYLSNDTTAARSPVAFCSASWRSWMYWLTSFPSSGPMDTTAPPLSCCPSRTPFSLLSTFRWASRAARPTPSRTTTMAAAAQIRCSRFMRGCGSVEALTNLLQVRGQRGLKAPAASVHGVVESELVGVKKGTFHGQSVGTTVAGVPHHGVSDRREVHAHLVRATRLQLALQKGGGHRFGIPLEHLVAGSGRPPPRRDRHPCRLARRASDRRVNHTLAFGHLTEHQREVPTLDVARLQLRGQIGERGWGAGHDHEPRRSFVEPMHDPRTLRITDRGEIGKAVQEAVHERALPLASAGVHHEAGGLVDDDEV